MNALIFRLLLAAWALSGIYTYAGAQAQGAPRTQPAATEYKIGSGDVVRIVVFQNPDLSLETRVTEAGVISYPLIGSVRLGGSTVTAAERLIADGLRSGGFVKNPQVTLIVTQVRGSQVNVLGQVNRPGRFPLELADMRLTDLLSIAGGVSIGGSDVVVVSGTRNGQAFRTEIDLPAVFAQIGKEKDILLENGDVIWVDRQPLVYIYGEVQRPGPMRLERGMSILQALATGGGLTQRGTEKGIRVHRKAADGKTVITQPAMDDKVQEGDVIYVRESLF